MSIPAKAERYTQQDDKRTLSREELDSMLQDGGMSIDELKTMDHDEKLNILQIFQSSLKDVESKENKPFPSNTGGELQKSSRIKKKMKLGDSATANANLDSQETSSKWYSKENTTMSISSKAKVGKVKSQPPVEKNPDNPNYMPRRRGVRRNAEARKAAAGSAPKINKTEIPLIDLGSDSDDVDGKKNDEAAGVHEKRRPLKTSPYQKHTPNKVDEVDDSLDGETGNECYGEEKRESDGDKKSMVIEDDDETQPPFHSRTPSPLETEKTTEAMTSHAQNESIIIQPSPQPSPSLKRKLPDHFKVEDPPAKTQVREECADPFAYFLWSEQALKDSVPDYQYKPLLSKKRVLSNTPARKYYAPDGRSVEKHAQTIKFYFEEYRVHLREAQNALLSCHSMEWGEPVVVGEANHTTINRRAEYAPVQQDQQRYYSYNTSYTTGAQRRTATRQTRLNNINNINILSRGGQMLNVAMTSAAAGIKNFYQKVSGKPVFTEGQRDQGIENYKLNDVQLRQDWILDDDDDDDDDFVTLSDTGTHKKRKGTTAVDKQDALVLNSKVDNKGNSIIVQDTDDEGDDQDAACKETDRSADGKGIAYRTGWNGEQNTSKYSFINTPSSSNFTVQLDELYNFDSSPRSKETREEEPAGGTRLSSRRRMKGGDRHKANIAESTIVKGDGEPLPIKGKKKCIGSMAFDTPDTKVPAKGKTYSRIRVAPDSDENDGSVEPAGTSAEFEESADCPKCGGIFPISKLPSHSSVCIGELHRQSQLGQRRIPRRRCAASAIQKGMREHDFDEDNGQEYSSSDEYKPKKEELKVVEEDESDDFIVDDNRATNRKRGRVGKERKCTDSTKAAPVTRPRLRGRGDTGESESLGMPRTAPSVNDTLDMASCPMCNKMVCRDDLKTHVDLCLAKDDEEQERRRSGRSNAGASSASSQPGIRHYYSKDEADGANYEQTNTVTKLKNSAKIILIPPQSQHETDYTEYDSNESHSKSDSESSNLEETVTLRQSLLSSNAPDKANSHDARVDTSPIRSYQPISGQNDMDFYRAQFKPRTKMNLEEIQQNREKRQKKRQGKKTRRRRQKVQPKKKK